MPEANSQLRWKVESNLDECVPILYYLSLYSLEIIIGLDYTVGTYACLDRRFFNTVLSWIWSRSAVNMLKLCSYLCFK